MRRATASGVLAVALPVVPVEEAGDRCARLAEAERLLSCDADNEQFGKSALIHIASFLYNLSAGLVLGFVFGHWAVGQEFILSGIAISEIQILSQPDRLTRDLELY